MLIITESPSGLDECNVGIVDEEWNATAKKIRFGLKISVEDDNILAMFDITAFETFLQRTSLVTNSVLSDLIPYIDSFTCPSLAFHLHHLLRISSKSLNHTFN